MAYWRLLPRVGAHLLCRSFPALNLPQPVSFQWFRVGLKPGNFHTITNERCNMTRPLSWCLVLYRIFYQWVNMPCIHRLFPCCVFLYGVVTRSDGGRDRTPSRQHYDPDFNWLVQIWSGHNATREQSMDSGPKVAALPQWDVFYCQRQVGNPILSP